MRPDLKKAQAIIEPIVRGLGCDLVELRFLSEAGRAVLRVSVDREGGISLGECQQISREIETPLEVEEVLPGHYYLEVSSPGLDRPLVKEEDYLKFAGRKAALRTGPSIEGRRNFKGILQGIEQGVIRMQIDGQEYRIPFNTVERGHLVFEGK
ncbi:MAG: ribosome maturation factor RimP [Deltaproteobacteria bacterium]|nr:ribosome maturation factor RimP [Deltaproteobacteria bacterium]MBI2500924.1 ribosome maturation factor RimP [Deltaproteobacteria bacterium]